MTVKKKKTAASNEQPENCESDIESCHENVHDIRYARIAENAYYRAEARGFEPGHELEDWIAAENDVRWY